MPENCALYLPFWSPNLSGSVFNSIDPYGHLCTVSGATWGNSGYSFDGTNDKITAPHNAALNWGDGDGAIAIWFKTATSGQTGTLLVKGATGAGGKRYILRINNNDDVEFNIDDNTNNKTMYLQGSYADNVWHFVLVGKDGDNLRGYIDGGTEHANSPLDVSGQGSLDSSTGLYIGETHDGSDDYTGYIGEILVLPGTAPSSVLATKIYNETVIRYA